MTDLSVSAYWLSITYVLGSLVICVGLIWVIVLTKEKISNYKIFAIILIGSFISLISFQGSFITKSFTEIEPGTIYAGNPGWGLWLFGIYYITFAFLIIYKLAMAYKHSVDRNTKAQIKFVLIGASITLGTTAVSSIMLPFFSLFLFGCFDSIGFLIFSIFVSYSIARYNLFNIKIILAEFVILAIWILLFLRVVFADNPHQQFVEGMLFIIFVIFGIMLIQSLLQNIQQRNDMKALTDKLEQAYKDLDKMDEIRAQIKRINSMSLW